MSKGKLKSGGGRRKETEVWGGRHEKTDKRCWYIRDFQRYSETEQMNFIIDFLNAPDTQESKLLISAPVVNLPKGLEDDILLVRVKPINQKDVVEILKAFLKKMRIEENPDSEELENASAVLLGFTEVQLLRLLDKACHINSRFFQRENLGFLKEIAQNERKKLAEKDGTLRFDDRLPIAAGMTRYIEWLAERADVYAGGDKVAREYGIPPIKGVIVTGVPGTGKTEMARRTAQKLGVPLVQFQLSALQSSKFGESEANLMRYLDRLDSMGRVVMMIDEIEKSLGRDEDGKGMHEVKEAQLGLMLGWLQDNKDVFCFFTANNAERLPPELTRDGRLSEKFYAFMPTADEVVDIIHSHMWRLHHESGDMLYAKDLLEKIGKDPFVPDDKGKTLSVTELTKEAADSIAAEKEKKDTLGAEVIREIVRRAMEKGKNEKGGEPLSYKRTPFLTGGNVIKLMEKLDLALMQEADRPYSYEKVREKMINTLCDDEFIPYGESNPEDIAQLWLYIREKRYVCVSQSAMLDPGTHDFDDETKKFKGENKPPVYTGDYVKDYEAWFKYCMRPKIEAVARRKIGKSET